jgi:hypothetical protein
MATCLTKRYGDTILKPTMEDLAGALAELQLEDPEHPDCWLSDEDEWTVAAFASGLVVLENAETLEGPWHMRAVSMEDVLGLWRLLDQGNLDELRNRPWQAGYGRETDE